MKSQRATANAAERQRSRSEADTGQRTGLSFCDSQSRAVRRHPTRRTATRRGSLHSPLAANCCCWSSTHFREWGGERGAALAARRAARAGRFSPVGPQHAACASRVAFLPGVRPAMWRAFIQSIGMCSCDSGRSQRGPNELREVAALRLRWLRPGRFFEPQGCNLNPGLGGHLLRVALASFRVPSGTPFIPRGNATEDRGRAGKRYRVGLLS